MSAAWASNEVSWLRIIILDLIVHLKVLISGSCTVFLKFESEMIQERYMIDSNGKVVAYPSYLRGPGVDLLFDRAAQVRLVGDPNLDRLPLDPPPPTPNTTIIHPGRSRSHLSLITSVHVASCSRILLFLLWTSTFEFCYCWFAWLLCLLFNSVLLYSPCRLIN